MKLTLKNALIYLFAIILLSQTQYLIQYLKQNILLEADDSLIYEQSEKEFKLSDETINRIVQLYGSYAGNVKIDNKAKKLLFAFSSDIDMVVSGSEFMHLLGCMPIYPKNYQSNLFNRANICEAILFFFTRGLGAEFYVQNGEEFKNLIKIARTIQKRSDLGGNSASMALRSFKEGADVYLHSIMSHKYHQQLFNESIKIIPQEFLQYEIRDVHLVIDFSEGDNYFLFTCPRTNRLFLQSDRDNIQLSGLNKIVDEVVQIKPHIFAIGGFQLMNYQPMYLIKQTVNKFKNCMDQIKQQITGIKLHFEMGSFSDPGLMQELLKNIVLHINSIGLNEQELDMLLKFLKTSSIYDGDIEDINLSTNGLISNVIKLIEILNKSNEKNLQRIHFHSSNFQMICSTDQWKDQKFALIRSILVGYQQATKIDNDNLVDEFIINMEGKQYYNFQPLQMRLPSINNKTISYSYHSLEGSQFDIDSVIKCWDITDQMKCCIAPSLLHPSPARTCGLGDNIAATSLIYQI